jgi:hypothetical protein
VSCFSEHEGAGAFRLVSVRGLPHTKKSHFNGIAPPQIRWSDSTVIKASATTPIRRDPPRLVFGKQLGPAAFHEFRFQSTRSLITREPQANRNAHSRRSRLVQEAEGAQSGLQRTYAIKAAMMPTAIPSANRLINSLLVIANISLTGGRRFLRPWTIQHQ